MLVSGVSVAQAKPSKIEFSRELDALSQALESVHPNPWRLQREQAFRDLLTSNPSILDSYPLGPWLTISRAISSLDGNNQDSVTGINLIKQRRIWQRLPLTLGRFDEGLFIIDAADEYTHFIGAQLIEINGKNVLSLFKQIARNFPSRDLGWIPHYLTMTELMRFYGARCQSDCTLIIEFAGQRREVAIAIDQLLRDQTNQMNATPVYLKDYFNRMNPDIERVDMIDPQSIRWDLSGNMLKSTLMFDEHVSLVQKLLNNQRLTNVVIDLRFITHTDPALIERFSRMVRMLLQQHQGKTIYVLIDRSTEPVVFELVARLADIPEVKFIGQKLETQLSHFHDPKPLTLGKTGITINIATRFQKFLTNYPEQQNITPLVVEWSADDFFAGEDTLVNTVQDLIEINQ